MSKTFETINDQIREFIAAQKMFFVATAPLSEDGLVNLSPKGLDGTFAILDDRTVAYLDLTGSGIETVAHVKENGRICVMFCAFEGPPKIVRIHGRGEVLAADDAEFAELLTHFPDYTGVRSIVRIHATRISDSCGFAVPVYEYKSQREQLLRWSQHKGEDEIAAYHSEKNATSLDGLPGIRRDK